MKNKLYWRYTASCFLLLFTFLGYMVKFYPEQLSFIDQPVTQLIRGQLTETKSAYFLWITKFGNPISIVLVTIAVALLLFRKKYYIEMLWLGVNTALIAGVGNIFLKQAFARPRPALEHLVHETSFSFPSAHALGSTLCYGTILLLLPRLIDNKKILRLVQVLLGLLILNIGLSRVYAGVHYPTDILGGFLLGAAWLGFTYPYYIETRTKLIFQKKQN